MEDSDGLVRLEAALNRSLSFRNFAKKVSKPELAPLVIAQGWKPFYLKGSTAVTSVRFSNEQNVDFLDLRQKFADSRFDVYRQLVSNFYDPDCGCEGTDG
jgi:hypothetical protein